MDALRTTRLIVVSTARDVAAMRRQMELAAGRGADAVECRLDYLDRPPTAEELAVLLAPPARPEGARTCEIIATCRPRREGGLYDGPEPSRLALLAEAARLGATYIDVEGDVPAERRPRGRLIVSHHDFERCPADAAARLADLGAGGAVGKIAFAARGPEDALAALELVRGGAGAVIALAMGEHGLASRVLCRKFGAFGTYASLEAGGESAPGQITLDEYRSLYRWEAIGPATALYGVIGCPISHSMSPAVHNAAMAACGLDAAYVPLRIEPGGANFDAFMDALLDRPWLGWAGLSVTIPHKENALAYVGKANCDELAVRIGAINTITIETRGGRSVNLRGDNTDYAAALDSLCAAMGLGRADLAGMPAAVLGAGGAARAVVAGLTHCGADVTIYNRTLERAAALAEAFGAKAAPPGDAPRSHAHIVVNCTPIGMHPNVDDTPLAELPGSTRVVFDTIYNPLRTRLLRQAQVAGVACVSGLDMFVNQAAAQFEIWTGRKAPTDAMRLAAARRLGA